MAGNQPGDNRPQDPWGGKGGGSQPPDLMKLLRDIAQRFVTWLGFKKPAGQKSRDSWTRVVTLLAIGLIGVFVSSGICQIMPDQHGVVLKSGQVKRVLEPGLHWFNPVLESLERVTVTGTSHYRLSGELATQDSSLVNAGVDVEYRIADPAAYVMAASDPVTLLQTLTLAMLREQVGKSRIDALLESQPAVLGDAVKASLVPALAKWHTGLEIVDVAITGVTLPETVKSGDSAQEQAMQSARAALTAASAYRDSQRQVARDQVEQLQVAAEAYRQQVVTKAETETARFAAQLGAYEKAPQVTRDRLYFDTMETLLAKNGKVLVLDSKSGQQLVLPLAELAKQAAARPLTPVDTARPDAVPKANDKAAPPAAPASPLPSLYGPILGSPQPVAATEGSKP